MSDILHVPSLVIAASVTGTCVSISHLLIWRVVKREAAVLIWGAAYGIMTIAMIQFALRGYIPALWSIVVSNAMLLLAFGLIWLGYRRFFGKAAGHDRFLILFPPLIWFALSFDQNQFADINFRTNVISVLQFIYLVVLLFELVRQSRKESLPALTLTVGVIVFQQSMLIIRTISIIYFPLDPNAHNLPNTLLIGLTLIGSIAVLVFLGLLQLALVAQRSERQFRVAAETDELTGLANRRRFLNEALPRLATQPDHGALVLFDLDHFKRINDTHGHLIGDRTLMEFARILGEAAPASAVTARVGGEEFALFLPDATAETAAALAERIRQLAQAYRLNTIKGELRFTVSGGVASVAEVGPDYETLNSAADTALYKAKSQGRNRVAVHHPDRPARQPALSLTDKCSISPASAKM